MIVKEAEAFAVTSADGDITLGADGLGFYSRDTRCLSRLELRLAGTRPSLLSASDDLVWTASADLCNLPLWRGDELLVAAMMISLRRETVISGRLHERIKVRSYSPAPHELPLELWIDADFADLLEVRGVQRELRGEQAPPEITEDGARFRYDGEDGVRRETIVTMSPPPTSVVAHPEGGVLARYDLHLVPRGSAVLSLQVTPVHDGKTPPANSFESTQHALRTSYAEWSQTCASVDTDSSVFNDLLERGCRDLRALLTPTPHGGVYAAGIPWYVTLFGRDSIFAAFQTLMLNPDPARDTLRCLAAYQGRQHDPWRDEQPGKILHEVRQGEFAGAGYVPFAPYYGSVDATPLFCVLYGSYFRWTGDTVLARELLPNAEAALAWVEEHGDSNGDGWVDYARQSPRGLANQGWKDSHDSVVHDDGRLAPAPIALAEVQAYVHLARLRMADVYEGLGRKDDAERQRALATELRTRFNETFWMQAKGYFAEAVDGSGRLVESISTNPAHGLYGGFIDADKAEQMAARLLEPEMFSGWGVRTMSRASVAYNPMSYHNGSIWPHDNALIAAGLKRYGLREASDAISTAIVDVATTAENRRLPELYCGFSRGSSRRPVSYPVACAPQAWAAGAPFHLLQAMLGISARADQGLLTITAPMLPGSLRRVTLRNVRVGQARVALEFTRDRPTDPTSFTMLERHGDVRVLMKE